MTQPQQKKIKALSIGFLPTEFIDIEFPYDDFFEQELEDLITAVKSGKPDLQYAYGLGAVDFFIINSVTVKILLEYHGSKISTIVPRERILPQFELLLESIKCKYSDRK